MRGSKAKAIRRKVYGDQSRRNERDYLKYKGTGQVINNPKSLRARYLQAKKGAV